MPKFNDNFLKSNSFNHRNFLNRSDAVLKNLIMLKRQEFYF